MLSPKHLAAQRPGQSLPYRLRYFIGGRNVPTLRCQGINCLLYAILVSCRQAFNQIVMFYASLVNFAIFARFELSRYAPSRRQAAARQHGSTAARQHGSNFGASIDADVANAARSAFLRHRLSAAGRINGRLEDIHAQPAAEDVANNIRFTAHKRVKAPALLVLPGRFPDLERLAACLL